MKLDKDHLSQFEDISPPMRDALSLPVLVTINGKPRDVGLVVYVCQSPFTLKSRTKKEIREIARRLVIITDEQREALGFAYDLIMNTAGGNQHHADALLALLARGQS